MEKIVSEVINMTFSNEINHVGWKLGFLTSAYYVWSSFYFIRPPTTKPLWSSSSLKAVSSFPFPYTSSSEAASLNVLMNNSVAEVAVKVFSGSKSSHIILSWQILLFMLISLCTLVICRWNKVTGRGDCWRITFMLTKLRQRSRLKM